MPTQLSQLFRFLKHDEKGENPIWIVTSAPFENDSRIYRIMYKDIENEQLNTDTEIIMHIEKKWKSSLEPIVRSVLKIQEEIKYVKEFRNACLDIMKDDPWIEEYLLNVFSALTKTRPWPYNVISSFV
jgi:hypothetical protein